MGGFDWLYMDGAWGPWLTCVSFSGGRVINDVTVSGPTEAGGYCGL